MLRRHVLLKRLLLTAAFVVFLYLWLQQQYSVDSSAIHRVPTGLMEGDNAPPFRDTSANFTDEESEQDMLETGWKHARYADAEKMSVLKRLEFVMERIGKKSSSDLVSQTSRKPVESEYNGIKMRNDDKSLADNLNDNLIFIQKIAERNFVKVAMPESRLTTGNVQINNILNNVQNRSDSIHLSASKHHEVTRSPAFSVTDIASRVAQQTSKMVEWDQSFRHVPTLPDYDLPIRREKVDPDRIKSQEVRDPQRPKTDAGIISTNSDKNTFSNDDDNDDDNQMSGVVIVGNVNVTRKYAVFSTTTENREALNFLFLVPLTALAWQRVGFDSVVVIVGSPAEWNSDPLYNFVLSSVRQLDAVVIFLEPRSEKSVMISQVSRIFVANILRTSLHADQRKAFDGVYFVTTDADLWPIYGDAYLLPPGWAILSLNSDCCGAFSHRGATYKMLPMANIGTNASTWAQLTRKFGHSPSSIDDILTYFVREFGSVALRPVRKGDNIGWFLDQMMVSLLIANWARENSGGGRVRYTGRDVGLDRVDRAGWNPGNNIDDKIDAHLLTEAYIPGVWVRLTHILRLLFGDMSDDYLWCVKYYEHFQSLFLAKYRSNRRHVD